MQRLTVVKVWYQNDFGRFGRRDERLARALLRDPRVARVIHVEPPLPRARCDAARAAGSSEGELHLFTPTYEPGAPNPLRDALEQTARFLASRGTFNGPALLWTSAPGAFADQLVAAIGSRFQFRVAEIEDDHRRWCVERSEEQLAVARRYERAVRCSDLLVSNAQSMVDEFARLQPHALRVANAVDLAPYEAGPAEPACLAGVPRPRLAYVGNLRLRLRPELFAAVADAHPQATLVLAGDDDKGLKAALRSGARKNVRFVGRIAPADVPGFLAHSDVLLLPHVTGPVTDAMDPQKLYEYLASGAPIVATPVAGARDHGDVVALADDPAAFAAAVGAALNEDDSSAPDRRGGLAARERRRAKVRGRTWEAAARQVLDAVLATSEPGARLKAEQAFGYFQHDRPEVRRLVPETARRLLDVGCGAGALGGAIKFRRDAHVTGIELDERAAARARAVLDEVWVGDALARLDELARRGERFDAILFADLLEHLPQPELALARAKELLAEGGVVITSLPNVRHWSVVRQLLEGEFRYEPAGILDRTHLRFFTRRSAQRLLQECGFAVEATVGARWAEEAMPEAVVAALAAAGVKVGDLAAESREHQWLLVARPCAGVAAVPNDPKTKVEMRVQDGPKVSVIVPVCNAADYTRTCLEELQIRGGLPAADLEILVVDNGSTDATAQVLAEHAPRITVIRNAENRGFAGAVNQGLQAARAPLVCVLNNDTLLTEGWLAPLVERLGDPTVGLAGPCTSYAKGRQQVDLTVDGQPYASHDEMRALATAWCARERGRIEDVDFLSGFCFVARRADLLPIGGLADAYGKGTFEDDELCRRLRRDGRRLVIARDSYVHHFGNRTFRALGIDLKAQQEENWKRFAARHGDDAGLLARVAAMQQRWRDVLKLALAAMKRSALDLDALWFAALATARLDAAGGALRLLERYLARCPSDVAALALRRECEEASERGTSRRNALPGRRPVAV